MNDEMLLASVSPQLRIRVVACRFIFRDEHIWHCGRYPKSLTWNEALKLGLRGATVAEIISCIGAPDAAIERVESTNADARDMLEVWWRGESRKTPIKACTYHSLWWLQQSTGAVISPWVNFVLRKTSLGRD
jgi:hypothetical protein